MARYRGRGDLPAPDVMLGRSPGWHESTIREWQAVRPGRTGRPRKGWLCGHRWDTADRYPLHCLLCDTAYPKEPA